MSSQHQQSSRRRTSSPLSVPVSGWLSSYRRTLVNGFQRLHAAIVSHGKHSTYVSLLPWRSPRVLTNPRSRSERRTASEDTSASDEDDEEPSFWVSNLWPVLDSMLAHGQYTAPRRHELGGFFAEQIAPFFGPEPSRDPTTGRLIPVWKSFMTDDFTPLEPSWTWKRGSAQPVVKFSAEAVPRSNTASGALDIAAQFADALNTCDAKHLQFDRTALSTVVDLLTTPVGSVQSTSDTEQGSTALSQVMMGFDIHHNKTAVKAYILPTLRARATGQSKLNVITSAVRACGAGACWENVFAYLSSQPNADPFLLAIDCADLAIARFKVYVRFPTSNIDLLLQHVSLGGRIPLSAKFIRAIRDLWTRLSADSDDSDGLYRVASQTSGGTPMYFSVERSAALPTPKFYIPVRLLGWDDHRVAKTVSQWLTAHGNPEAGRSYIAALQAVRYVPQLHPSSVITD